MKPATIVLVLGCLSVGSITLSTIHPWGNPRDTPGINASLMENSEMPNDVQSILETRCSDCHSERTRYPIYSRLAPISWMLDRDVQTARRHFNMSQWRDYSAADRIGILTKIASEVHNDQMPPRRYLLIHPQAHLSPSDQQLVYDWARSERKRLRAESGNNSAQPSVQFEANHP